MGKEGEREGEGDIAEEGGWGGREGGSKSTQKVIFFGFSHRSQTSHAHPPTSYTAQFTAAFPPRSLPQSPLISIHHSSSTDRLLPSFAAASPQSEPATERAVARSNPPFIRPPIPPHPRHPSHPPRARGLGTRACATSDRPSRSGGSGQIEHPPVKWSN